MSHLYIMTDSKNHDRNTLHDICQAVREAGATVVDVNEESACIEATSPHHEISTISAMEGVSYVRPSFSYFSMPALKAA